MNTCLRHTNIVIAFETQECPLCESYFTIQTKEDEIKQKQWMIDELNKLKEE